MNRLIAHPVALLVLLIAILPAASSADALEIELTSSNWRPVKIEIEPFLGEGPLPYHVSEVIHDDLLRSGHFHPELSAENTYGDISPERYRKLRNAGFEYLVSGSVEKKNNRFEVTFQLHDGLSERILGSYRIPFDSFEQIRAVSHQVSNWVFEFVVGNTGIFNSKIAFITKTDDEYNLYIADYDGFNRRVVLSNKEPIMSPTWTPDGEGLLYVSFEQRKPIIYWQSLTSGKRRIIANFKGSNSAPAISPNQREIAAALSKEGGTQIFILSPSGNRVQRMRESFGIDTSPVFSPNGDRLLFVSDESGSPQIYEFNRLDNSARRLTFGSSRNEDPSYTSDGAYMVYLRRDEVGFNVYLRDLSSGNEEPLTEMSFASSPSVSPNDAMVVFVDESRAGKLFIVSVNGRVMSSWDFSPSGGRIRSPTWSPGRSSWF